jgi:5-methylcytosine-specific restriction endonuclease McrA
MDLSTRSDEELLASVTKLVASHRELTARLVAHLAEIEERRLHLSAGFSSMFDFCQKRLGLSEGEAFRRILAARLTRRFPTICTLLASGSVNLSTLERLHNHLTEENHAELLSATAGKSKQEVQSLLAACFPEPDHPSSIRLSTGSGRASIDPLSETRHKVEFTASDALRQKLELCRDLMSHANPRRDLAPVIERAVDLLLTELKRKRLAKAKRPRRPRVARPGDAFHNQTHQVGGVSRGSRVTNATRRQVFERDGLRCTYVAADGRRCDSRAFLELDQVNPRALGGSNDADNLRVLCRAHNQLRAERTFGRERIERARHFCRKKSTAGRSESAHESTAKPTALTKDQRNERTAPATLEKVHLALRQMGFREAEARRAISRVISMHDSSESLALEQALREAILVATAA